MSIHYDIQILLSKLIAMTRLTHRRVAYSIKAMRLGRLEVLQSLRLIAQDCRNCLTGSEAQSL